MVTPPPMNYIFVVVFQNGKKRVCVLLETKNGSACVYLLLLVFENKKACDTFYIVVIV